MYYILWVFFTHLCRSGHLSSIPMKRFTLSWESFSEHPSYARRSRGLSGACVTWPARDVGGMQMALDVYSWKFGRFHDVRSCDRVVFPVKIRRRKRFRGFSGSWSSFLGRVGSMRKVLSYSEVGLLVRLAGI